MPSLKSPIRSALRKTAALTVGVALTLTAAGCSAGSDTPATTPTTLTLALGTQPPSFDPTALDLGESASVWLALYDTLLYLDETNTVQPGAAESWEYSEDALTLTLNLRDGLEFSDGTPVTAADAAATIEYSLTTPGTTQNLLSSVASAEAPDDSTVVVHLTKPDAGLTTSLATAGGVIAPAALLGDESMALTPVGSGPYTLDTDATVTGASYVLAKRDDYWNAAAYPFESVTLNVISDPQAVFNALQAGEIDSASVSPDQVETVEAAGFAVKDLKSTAVGGLFILDKVGAIVPALADVRVRQAINMAIDRDLYVEQTLLGAGAPTEQVFNQLGPAYNADVAEYYEYDVAGAKELLAEAGYPDGFSVKLPSTYLSTSIEPAVTQSLGDIGITAEWVTVPPQEIVSSLFSGQFGMTFFYNGLGNPPRDAEPTLNVTGFLAGGYTDPELTELFAKANAEQDEAARNAIYMEISDYAVKEALHVPFYTVQQQRATKEGIVYLPDSGAIPNIRFFTTD